MLVLSKRLLDTAAPILRCHLRQTIPASCTPFARLQLSAIRRIGTKPLSSSFGSYVIVNPQCCSTSPVFTSASTTFSKRYLSSGQPPPPQQPPPWINPNNRVQGQALQQYSIDLTKLAAEGKLDPVIGRHEEIRRTLQILARRTKNNPILIGEPGVGKTAIAEGLAQRYVFTRTVRWYVLPSLYLSYTHAHLF